MNAIIRQTIDESWAAFQEVLESVPAGRLEEDGACGEWSVKDLMAHVAYWDDRAVYVADTLGADNAVEEINWEEVNLQEAALRASWSVEESRAEMHAAHERLLEAVERHPDLAAGVWEENTFEHYNEHAADIRAWLGK